MKQKILINGRIYTVDTESHFSETPAIEDHVEITTVDEVVQTGEGEHDFIIKKKVIETMRCKNSDYINSFADMVGIEKIVQKATLPGNAGLLNQVNGQYLDIPAVPSDSASQKAIIKQGQEAAAAAGVSFTEEGIQAMIDKAVAAALKPIEGGNE